ncbi:protein O-mannosyl-transferase 2-like, partial [Saccoglossus kowalevskii]
MRQVYEYRDVSYVEMRQFCAFLGSLIVPLVYLTVWEVNHSNNASTLAALFILCDTGCLTLSQYILLDPILMFFIMGATYCIVKFHNLKNQPFERAWYFWMSASGVFLACAFSVKWVGLFVILLAGLLTLSDLLQLLADLTISK